MLSFFPRDVFDEILDLIESVSETLALSPFLYKGVTKALFRSSEI